MKKFVLLIVSLVPAAAICLLLMKAGVLRFNAKNSPDAAVERKEIVRMPVVKEYSPLSDSGAMGSSGTRPPQAPPAADREQPVPAPELPDSSVDKTPSARGEDPLLSKALPFLSENGKDPAGIEERFRTFLTEEAGLDGPGAERCLRMSFWKNFVTLQRDWGPQETGELKASFAREKALKRAGFAAKGLTLISIEMREAEARFDAMLRELSAAGPKKEGQ